MTILANIKKVFDQSEDVFEKEIRKIRTKKFVTTNMQNNNKRVRVAVNGFGRIGRAFVIILHICRNKFFSSNFSNLFFKHILTLIKNFFNIC
jgi:D-arabinose 5-phosphate isomerase GutQ